MRNILFKIACSTPFLAAMDVFAQASTQPPTRLPEPGAFELLAIGGVAAVVVAVVKRRKK